MKVKSILCLITTLALIFTQAGSALAAQSDVTQTMPASDKAHIKALLEDITVDTVLDSVFDYEYHVNQFVQREGEVLQFSKNIAYTGITSDSSYLKISARLLDSFISEKWDVTATHNFSAPPADLNVSSPNTVYYQDGYYYIKAIATDKAVFTREYTPTKIMQLTPTVFACSFSVSIKEEGVDTAPIVKTGYAVVKKRASGYRLLEFSQTQEFISSAKEAYYTKKTALPSTAKLYVDGKSIPAFAYQIDGSNYYRLRDIAQALNGTGSSFEVTWDAAKNAIVLTKGAPYTPDGSSFSGGGAQNASESSAAVFVGSAPSSMEAYMIGGSNFYKIRDLGTTLGFAVEWNASANAVEIKP